MAVAVLSVAAVAAQSPASRREPDVPYVPTTEAAVQAMLKLGEVKKSDVVYDLGCGDGRIVIAAAKSYGARGVGIDINPVRIGEAKENAKKAGVEKLVRFEENDLFDAKIGEATVVTLFLLPNTFDMGDWKPEKEFIVPDTDVDTYLSHRLYLWIVPAQAGK
jgi:SAM-dependent methyltransferase